MVVPLVCCLSDCSITGLNSGAWTDLTRATLNVTFLEATPSTWSRSADAAVTTPGMVGIAASAFCISGLCIADIAPIGLLLPLLPLDALPIDDMYCDANLLTSATDVYCHLSALSS